MQRSQTYSTQPDVLNEPEKIVFPKPSGTTSHKPSSNHCIPTIRVKEENEIHVYQEIGETLVVNRNSCIGHVGLQVFAGTNCIGEMWVSDEDMAAVIGETNPSDRTIIDRLREYID